MRKHTILAAMAALSLASGVEARELYLLNENWRSVCYPEGRQDSLVVDELQLPHNWDDYYGYYDSEGTSKKSGKNNHSTKRWKESISTLFY